jgi:hypothetical protein
MNEHVFGSHFHKITRGSFLMAAAVATKGKKVKLPKRWSTENSRMRRTRERKIPVKFSHHAD